MKVLPWCSVPAVLMLAAGPSQAKVYLSIFNQTQETSFYLTDTPVKLNSAGVTTASFSLAAATQVLITYSAECKSSPRQGNVSIRILVDGTALPPNAGGKGITFCNEDLYATHSVTLSKLLPAGTHKLRVFGYSYAGGLGYLKASSLTVSD